MKQSIFLIISSKKIVFTHFVINESIQRQKNEILTKFQQNQDQDNHHRKGQEKMEMDTTDLTPTIAIKDDKHNEEKKVSKNDNKIDDDHDIIIGDNVNNQCQDNIDTPNSTHKLEETVNDFITNTRSKQNNGKVIFSMNKLCEIINQIQQRDEIQGKEIKGLISNISGMEQNLRLRSLNQTPSTHCNLRQSQSSKSLLSDSSATTTSSSSLLSIHNTVCSLSCSFVQSQHGINIANAEKF